MSTKNLRELVDLAEETCPGRPINAVARGELKAIERAAKAWAASDHGELPEELGDLMECIASEAP